MTARQAPGIAAPDFDRF